MAARTLTVGLIGYGLAGRVFHAPCIAAVPGLRLAAVVSRDPARVAADLPGVPVRPDLAALLARDAPDLVIVASPDALHAEHALAALEAGAHVVVDKPLAPTLAQARAIAARADARGRIAAVFHNRRWDADFLAVRALLAEGRLGTIGSVESRFDRFRPVPKPGWKEARAGGIWLDLGPHLVDQALVLFGRPEAIWCDLATQRPDASAPDACHAVLRYGAMRVVLGAGKLVPDHRRRFALHGTAGSFVKDGTDPQEAALLAGGCPGDPGWGADPRPGRLTTLDATGAAHGELFTGPPGDYAAFYRALAAAIHGDAPNPVPLAEALAVMEVLDAGLLSARERQEVRISPTSDPEPHR